MILQVWSRFKGTFTGPYSLYIDCKSPVKPWFPVDFPFNLWISLDIFGCLVKKSIDFWSNSCEPQKEVASMREELETLREGHARPRASQPRNFAARPVLEESQQTSNR